MLPTLLRSALLLVTFGALGLANAAPRLADIFQDGAVLQRSLPVPVWGWADPGSKVTVSFAGQNVSAQADPKGYWKAVLQPLEASSEGRELVVSSGSETITLKDLLVGEVWLVAGQSNMRAGGEDLDTGIYPHYQTQGSPPEIRIRDFGWGASLDPLEDTDPTQRGKEKWTVMPESPAPAVMNIGQYFSRVIRDTEKVPVGMIIVAVPGTNQAAWMSRETLEKFPAEGAEANYYQSFLAQKEAELAASKGPFKSWEDFMKADAEWRQDPKGLWPARSVLNIPNFPTALYNTRIHPLAPYAVRGVLWHQGEGGPRGPYGKRLVAMFKQWRQLFGQEFPVIWGTLSRHTASQPPIEPSTEGFYRSFTNTEIRMALELFEGDPKTEYVEFFDLGNYDTHFLQKAEAGRRMGLAALAKVYGKQQLYSGPRMKSTKIAGGEATIEFEYCGEGLTYQPSIAGISGIYLRGADGTARWAQVKQVNKNTIAVSHPDIADLKVVAYASNPNPHETLFNSAGLPASPFTVNPGDLNYKDAPPALELIRLDAGTGKPALHVSHVRSEGYIFAAKEKGGSEPIAVHAYIPKEWSGYEVEIDGKPITATESTDKGEKFIQFQLTVNGPPAIVAQKGKAAEFRKVNRF